MTDFDARPPAIAAVPAVLAAAVAAFFSLYGSPMAVMLAGPGLVAVAYGTRGAERRWVTLGAALAFLGATVAAATGLPSAFALLAGAAAIVAYDTGEHAVSLGTDVGRRTRVTHSVAVHAAGSVVVASVVASLAYALYQFGPTSLPVTGLVALLVASVLLAYVLSD